MLSRRRTKPIQILWKKIRMKMTFVEIKSRASHGRTKSALQWRTWWSGCYNASSFNLFNVTEQFTWKPSLLSNFHCRVESAIVIRVCCVNGRAKETDSFPHCHSQEQKEVSSICMWPRFRLMADTEIKPQGLPHKMLKKSGEKGLTVNYKKTACMGVCNRNSP